MDDGTPTEPWAVPTAVQHEEHKEKMGGACSEEEAAKTKLGAWLLGEAKEAKQPWQGSKYLLLPTPLSQHHLPWSAFV